MTRARRTKNLAVTPEVLVELLRGDLPLRSSICIANDIPADAKVVGAYMGQFGEFVITLESAAFPEVPLGCVPSNLTPIWKYAHVGRPLSPSHHDSTAQHGH